jgi:ADP-heptose:LPS heptosyltransferase
MKILVVRVGKAGDMVMITPALRTLLRLYPHAEFHLLTSPDGRRVLHGFDARISKVFIYPTGVLNEILHRRRIVRGLKDETYTHAFVFEGDPRYHNLIGLTGVPASLLHRNPLLHYSECCLSLVRPHVNLPVQETWIELPVTDEGRKRSTAYLREYGIRDNDIVVGFHATSSSSLTGFFRGRKRRVQRTWPADRFASLAVLLLEHAAAKGLSLRILMDVLPEERRLVEPIIRMSAGIVVVASAPPDFERYKAVLQRMTLLVTPDTGPMHIAAAVGTPVVALFSGKAPEDCGPFVPAEKYAVLRAENSTQPELGLAAITSQSVLQACRPFLHRQHHSELRMK